MLNSFHNPPLPVQYRRRAGEAGGRGHDAAGRHVGGVKPKLRSRHGEHPRPAGGFGRRARTLATHYFGNSRREKVCGTWFSARRRKPRAGGVCSPATAAGAQAGAARRWRSRERGGKTQGQLNLPRGLRMETVRAPVKGAFPPPLGWSKASFHFF